MTINPISVPQVLWAQRESEIFLTIELSDVSEKKLDVSEKKLTFSGMSNGKQYGFELELFAPIDMEASKQETAQRNVFMVLKKVSDAWWPRLTTSKVHFVKTDFSRWRDEDDEEEEDVKHEMGDMGALGGMGGMPGMGGMDFSKFAGMGGMGGDFEGMGGESDSDDEIPEIENDEEKKE